MACNGMNSCRGSGDCKAMSKKGIENSVGMDKKRKDLIANSKFKRVMSEYGIGTLKTSAGGQVNSAQQAEEIAASESGQSYNQAQKNRKSADRFGMKNRGQK